MQRAGPAPVLSGGGRERSGLVAILSQPTGVGGRECKTIGYTCRTGALKIFGREFNSRRLHHVSPWVLNGSGAFFLAIVYKSTSNDLSTSKQTECK